MDDFDDTTYRIDGRHLVNLGVNQVTVRNFITATTAVIVDSFSFVFVAYVDLIGDSYIIGVSVQCITCLVIRSTTGYVYDYYLSSSMRILLLY